MSWIRRTSGAALAPAWIMALAATLGGCGGPSDSLPREPVSGKVRIEGTPLAKGSISFRAADGSMAVGGLVNDGTFAIPRAEGPVPGKYQVSVNEAVDATLDLGSEKFSIQPKTKPSRTIIGTLDVEVKEGGNDDFNLEFKRGAAGPRGRR